MAILKFYSKLVNDILPNYFESFTPQFSAGQQHYNFRNPSRLLPKIKYEFPKTKCSLVTNQTVNGSRLASYIIKRDALSK